MDFHEIKQHAIELRQLLKKEKISADIIILYGSYASRTQRPDSDIDLAVISRDYGKDRFTEGSRLNFIASHIDPRIEAVPFGLEEYMSSHSISPLLHEIQEKGIVLL